MSYPERIGSPDLGKATFYALLATAGVGVVAAALYMLYNESHPLLNDPSRSTLDTNRTPLPPNEVVCPECGKLRAPVTTGGLCIDCYQRWDT